MTTKICRRLWALVTLGAAMTSLAGCQTTSMAARSSRAQAATQGEQCDRMQNRRGDCEDQVGCAWDFDGGRCVAQ
jgi:hypothetical protein